MTRKDQRQPEAPPTSAAMPAITSGLNALALWLAKLVIALSRPRRPIGYWSAISDPWTEMLLDLDTPAPNWARNSMRALTDKPTNATMAERMRPAQAMMG